MPEEVKDVNMEEQETTTSVDENSSNEDIAKAFEEKYPDEPVEAEPTEESSSSEQQSDASGEDVKTPEATEEKSGEKVADDEIKEGQSIPYDRWKQKVDQFNSLQEGVKSKDEQLKQYEDLFSDPSVLTIVRKKQGYTQEAIDKELKELGHEVKQQETKPKEVNINKYTEGLDMNTQEGWIEAMKRVAADQANTAIEPIKQTLSAKEQAEIKAKHESWLREEEKQARVLAKEKYGLEFGENGKSENNLDTAIGIMNNYLSKNPQDAKLGYIKILKLAMFDKGNEIAENRGVAKEKTRQEELKNSAMETDSKISKDEFPTADWTDEQIMDYAEKHPNAMKTMRR